MKDLLNYIITNIVTKPEKVKIDEEKTDGIVTLFLSVDPEDMGIVIGKGGQTINAIRKILTVRAIAENIRVNLQLEDSGEKPQENTQKEPEEE